MMNTKGLAGEVASLDYSCLTTTGAEKTIEQIMKIITDTLASDGEVRLAGFGTFKVINVKGRQGRNPQTGEAITIPEHNKVSFKPAKNLKEKVN